MTRAEIRNAVLKALTDIAPEVNPQSLRGDVSLREQVDLDSFDYLNLMVALHASLGADIPERDYPSLTTLDGIVEYLVRVRTARAEPAP